MNVKVIDQLVPNDHLEMLTLIGVRSSFSRSLDDNQPSTHFTFSKALQFTVQVWLLHMFLLPWFPPTSSWSAPQLPSPAPPRGQLSTLSSPSLTPPSWDAACTRGFQVTNYRLIPKFQQTFFRQWFAGWAVHPALGQGRATSRVCVSWWIFCGESLLFD